MQSLSGRVLSSVIRHNAAPIITRSATRLAPSQMPNLMDIGSRTIFSPEQDMFRENVRRFMREELAPNHARYEKQGKVDKETWKKLGSQGKIYLKGARV